LTESNATWWADQVLKSAPAAPAVFHEMVKEEFFLPWEARALDGLELPEWAEKNVAAVISISLSSVSGVEKTRHFNWLSGRFTGTKWAENCD
jgi:hypothetical protein